MPKIKYKYNIFALILYETMWRSQWGGARKSRWISFSSSIPFNIFKSYFGYRVSKLCPMFFSFYRKRFSIYHFQRHLTPHSTLCIWRDLDRTNTRSHAHSPAFVGVRGIMSALYIYHITYDVQTVNYVVFFRILLNSERIVYYVCAWVCVWKNQMLWMYSHRSL